jgi:hypothetical protein
MGELSLELRKLMFQFFNTTFFFLRTLIRLLSQAYLFFHPLPDLFEELIIWMIDSQLNLPGICISHVRIPRQ